jgi:DNA replication protein DnaC
MTEMRDQSIKGAQMSEKHFFEHCVPKKFSHVTLDQCDKQPKSFHDYAKSWGSKPESTILLGDVGRGKTQFAFAMIREMFRRSPRKLWPRYYTSPEMDSILLKASRDEDADKAVIHKIASEDLLFIDDFGREMDSARAKRQYFEVLNLRYANLLPTLISTNLTLEEIQNHMNKAIASRFQEFQIIEFGGVDLRVQRKIS